MTNNNIIHFVGFVTRIEPEDFVPQWEQYARHFKQDGGSMELKQSEGPTGKGRFKYLSRHTCKDGSIRFSFMKERNSEHFPEQQVKVVQAGGYILMQVQKQVAGKRKDTSIFVLVSPKKNDNSFYQQLTYSGINIYDAYYENCLYSSILEFIVSEKEAPELLEQLKEVEGIEVALYRDCRVPHL